MKKSITAPVIGIYMLIASFALAGDLILFDNFEAYELDSHPNGWTADDANLMSIVNDPAKSGEKSLKIDCRADERDVWFEFGREVQVVTVEFWIFPSTASRTLSLLLLNASVDRANAGPYMGWGIPTAGSIGRYAGGGWASTGIKFEDSTWTYVKVVADATRSPKSFDFYQGEDLDKLPAEPQGKSIPYRNTSLSAFDRILFLGWSDVVGQGYIDDALIYEGTKRPAGVGKVSVEPMGKMAIRWGKMKIR